MKVEELLQEIRRDFTAEKIASLTQNEAEVVVTQYRQRFWQMVGEAVKGRSADMAKELLASAVQTTGVMSGMGRLGNAVRSGAAGAFDDEGIPVAEAKPRAMIGAAGPYETPLSIAWCERSIPEVQAHENAAAARGREVKQLAREVKAELAR